MIINKKHIAALLVIITTCFAGNAQQEFTLYHMPVLSQSTYLNPASLPDRKVSISLPALGGIFVGFNNSAFSVQKLVQKDGTVDYMKFLETLKTKNNYIGLGAKVDLLNVRWKFHNNFYSISSRIVTDFRFNFPKALLEVPVLGNASYIGDEIIFSSLGIDATAYIETGFGMTVADPHSKWVFGGKFKHLAGLVNVQTKKSDFKWGISDDIYQYDLQGDFHINAGGALSKDFIRTEVTDSSIIFETKDDFETSDIKINNGFALDGGVSYKYNKKLTFGGAFNNLGFIRWKNATANFKANGNAKFEGVYLDNIAIDSSGISGFDSEGVMDSIFESYLESYNMDITNDAYYTWLPTQLFLSAHYDVFKNLRLSGTLYTEFYKGVHLGPVIGANWYASKNFSLSANWWYFRKSWKNLGVGFVTTVGPVQLYFAFDNVLAGVLVSIDDQDLGLSTPLMPYHAQNINMRFGINFVFGKIRNLEQSPFPKKKK